jgi:predicted transcriptional regulator
MKTLIELGREVGYTPAQVRNIVRKEKLFLEILECETVEDVKILLMHWVDQGKIK